MTGSSQLTYAGVLLAVFTQQICLPVPSMVFLMAAGALSAHGGMQASIAVFLGVLGCLAADSLWFWFGRRWGSRAVRLVCGFTTDPRGSFRNAQEKFRRYGFGILCVAKLLPPLGGVTPPLAGAQGLSLSGFLAFDAVGSLLWSSFYVALGYLLSDQVDVAIGWARHFGTILGIAIGAPIALYVFWRGPELKAICELFSVPKPVAVATAVPSGKR
jgi:membrane protein DedA with SNARE-associated domain